MFPLDIAQSLKCLANLGPVGGLGMSAIVGHRLVLGGQCRVKRGDDFVGRQPL
jgi:hypothetical protein